MIILSRLKQASSGFFKVLLYGRSDVRTADPCLPHGIDSKPNKEDLTVFADTNENGSPIILGTVKNSSVTEEGETRIYATDSDGVEQFSMILKNSGQLQFGGTGDYLARFNELKAGYDQLKSDFNSLVSSYNAHIHITTATVGPSAVPGVISPTVSSAAPSTASIDAAKIDEIEVSS